ncbi:MAG: hypothetical protein FWE16_00845 [Firmicutes bacterium]|nr:hypothetical protein [Bacillota bacterium]
MFIPIGGVFIFGNGQTRFGATIQLIVGLLNMLFGGITIFFGFYNYSVGAKIFGFIIGGLGLFMVIFAISSIVRGNNKYDNDVDIL